MPTTATLTRTPAEHSTALVALLEATGLRCGPLLAGEVTVELDTTCGYCRHPVPHGVGERHHLAAGVIETPDGPVTTCVCGYATHAGDPDGFGQHVVEEAAW